MCSAETAALLYWWVQDFTSACMAWNLYLGMPMSMLQLSPSAGVGILSMGGLHYTQHGHQA